MTEIKFYSLQGELNGFEMNGHSDWADEGSDIVCASLSSCAYMTANTITDVIGVEAEIEIDDAYMSLFVSKEDCSKVKDIMRGFEMHVKALADDYSKYIVCKNVNIQ